jgi:hypothetical protein
MGIIKFSSRIFNGYFTSTTTTTTTTTNNNNNNNINNNNNNSMQSFIYLCAELNSQLPVIEFARIRKTAT